MDTYQESQITNGGDCSLHWHSLDRVVRHEDIEQQPARLQYNFPADLEYPITASAS